MNKHCSRRSGRVISLLLIVLVVTLIHPLNAQAREHPRVLVLISSGLSWSDIDPAEKEGKEFLEALGTARVANLTRHNAAKTTCPLDGYLSLSTGMRVTPTKVRAQGHCPEIPALGDGVFSAAALKEWQKDAARQNEQAVPGTLGESLAEQGKKVVAIGPGASVAAMDNAGKVANYRPQATSEGLTSQVKATLEDAEVTIVDVGAVSPNSAIKVSSTSLNATPADGLPGADRTDKPRSKQVLASLTAALKAAQDADLVFGLDVADHSATPHLGMAFTRAPGEKPGIIRSSSTRQLGLVSTVDFTSRILDATGADAPEYLVGGTFSAARDYGIAGNLDWLRNQALRSDQASILQARFIVLTGIILLAALGLLLFLLRREYLGFSRRSRKVIVLLCLSASLLGPASFLAANIPAGILGGTGGNFTGNALQMSVPLLTVQFFLLLIAIAAILAAFCLAAGKVVAGRWSGLEFSAPVLVAAILVLIWLLVSLLTGSPDQISAMFSSAATAATRFYGLNNNKYSFLFAAVLALECLVLAPAAARFPQRRHRYFIYGFTLLVVAVILDGFPWLGADVGGPLALVLGVGITLNWVLGKKVGPGKVIALIVAAFIASSLFVLVDKLASPPARTHFGRFISEVANGGGGIIVKRKAEAMINTFGGPLTFTVLLILGAGVTIWCLIKRKRGVSADASRPHARLGGGLSALNRIPGAGYFAKGVLLTSILAALTNDSGALILVCAGLFTLPALDAMLILSAKEKSQLQKTEKLEAK
ncbi:hypothetical protein [uncultured Varibaculum sp.]|uniref:hypothetical protein n=1 Tax=uncultured Varibaculum sp. TaxID=413896 RepID=UPI002583F379|nr:hypothetical protein [uncultured Varibaculum sp.]